MTISVLVVASEQLSDGDIVFGGLQKGQALQGPVGLPCPPDPLAGTGALSGAGAVHLPLPRARANGRQVRVSAMKSLGFARHLFQSPNQRRCWPCGAPGGHALPGTQAFRGRRSLGWGCPLAPLIAAGAQALPAVHLEVVCKPCSLPRAPRGRRFSLLPGDCFGSEGILGQGKESLLGVSIVFPSFFPFKVQMDLSWEERDLRWV